ncbi:MAG: metal-dependent transcriptional regulator [Defluviitaleaceae bacterium]|nr:metal-dependent transcriptional regulator [Defluviitaleaceae bacterium]
MLSSHGSSVRSIDIVNELDYTRPSVSVAMKKLRESGFIEVNTEGYITLTEAGLKIAESMYERHQIISNWLISMGVDEKTALDDACRMEHVISEQSFLAIKNHVEATR